jgi:serine/threonine protein kinase
MWAPGDKVDRFKLERIIGQGGFGMTYLAKDTSLNPPVY